MPVQINELTVRVAVEDAPATSSTSINQQGGSVDANLIIKKCVEEVMEALQRKNER